MKRLFAKREEIMKIIKKDYAYPRHSDLLVFSHSVDDKGNLTEWQVRNIITKKESILPYEEWHLLFHLDGLHDPYSFGIDRDSVDKAMKSFEGNELLTTKDWLCTEGIRIRWLGTVDMPVFVSRVIEVFWEILSVGTILLAVYYLMTQRRIVEFPAIKFLLLVICIEFFRMTFAEQLVDTLMVIAAGDEIAALYRTDCWQYPIFASYTHKGSPDGVPDLSKSKFLYSYFLFGLFLFLGLIFNDRGLWQGAALYILVYDIVDDMSQLMDILINKEGIDSNRHKKILQDIIVSIGKTLFFIIFFCSAFGR
jgi:hypothetical protein